MLLSAIRQALNVACKLMRPPAFLDSFPLWLYYPSLIKWKISQRNQLDIETKDYLIYTINASILIDLATFIEGIACEMQSTIFFQRLDNRDKFQWNLFKHFDNRLNNSTWTNYVEFFDLLLGEKLVSKIDNEKWKAISVLFNFRNSLVHGKEIEILYEDINNEPTVEAYDRHKKVFEYLKEKKLIDLTFKPNLNSVNLLNNNVVDHFFQATIDFVEKLFSILPESEIDDLKENFKECLTL
jgi:uncharacterized protein YutE (UPF0331/DUF86 family)